MRKTSKFCRPRFIDSRKAASPAVSMVIITAATVVLVLVSSSYALQALDRQQASTEFDALQTSFVTFDDAFRDIAFDRGGSRSVSFTTKFGYMSLLANEKNLSIGVVAGSNSQNFSPISLGVIKYSIPTSYITFGNGYQNYILGDNANYITASTDSLGRLKAEQSSNFLTMALDYRVRVTRQGPAIQINGEWVNYIDVFVLRANIAKSLNVTGNFDVIAKNLEITTKTWSSGGTVSGAATINISFDGASNQIQVPLDKTGKVVVNLILADVKVSI